MCFDNTGRRLITASRDGYIKMWNFNNGQLLKKMVQLAPSEVTDIFYMEIGANRCILSVGWDKQITVFPDEPDATESFPLRYIPATKGELSINRPHKDDILSIAFLPPNILATSSSDGEIIIWHLESGYARARFADPNLEFRGLEERSVEAIAFLYDEERDRDVKAGSVPLASCHADGYLRFWNVRSGALLYEYFCQSFEHVGLTAMSVDKRALYLILGDSVGFVRVCSRRLPCNSREIRYLM